MRGRPGIVQRLLFHRNDLMDIQQAHTLPVMRACRRESPVSIHGGVLPSADDQQKPMAFCRCRSNHRSTAAAVMRQTRPVQPSPQQHPVSQQSTAELGRTGMILSRVGLGTWAQGGGGWAAGWGPQDDRESMAAIRAAVEAGINWIDTAPAYGHGHAEEVVGQVMAEMAEGDRPYVFTKLGRH